jgi:hypothetical protein
MREDDFREWLENTYVTKAGKPLQKRPIGDAVSRCKRVGKHEGDLDQLFKRDSMQDLLDRLTYTRDEQKANNPPRHNIKIEGDIYSGTSSLRSALNKYKKFCECRTNFSS